MTFPTVPLRPRAAAALALLTVASSAATVARGAASRLTVQIDSTRSYQRMEGFGASLTESSASLMTSSMSATQRSALMQTLFSPTAGIGLSFLRQPMGSSDFALSPYTYDDVASGQTDYNLTHFSIARDQTQIIPLLQQAGSLNASLRIMGTPWTPPAWMKQASAVQPSAEQFFGGHLKNSDSVYNTYANYFVKYVQAYAAAGVKVNYLSLQNEPWYETTTYPSMGMDPWEQAKLVKLVGPKIAAAGLDTRLLAWDHNWDNAENYVSQLFSDSQAMQYFDGVAFHGYGGDVSAQTVVHNQFPTKGVFFTELTSTINNTNFAGDLMWDMQNLIVGGTRNWASTIVRWNLALDASGGPRLPGGAPNCRGMVTINPSTGAVTLNEEYYSIAHISKFVQPGAYRVDSDSDHSVTFVNPDGSTSLIAFNDATSPQDVTVHWKGRALSYRLPAQSVATLAWSDVRGSSVQVWLTTGDKTRLLARQSDASFVGGAWSRDNAGDWFDNSNWSAGAPNGADAEANFYGAISAAHTVWANRAASVGTLRFNSANRYVLAGAGSLSIATSAGSGLIEVASGSHKINLPLTFASDSIVSVAAGSALQISDPVTINAGVQVTQSGAGTVSYESTITLRDGASMVWSGSGASFETAQELFPAYRIDGSTLTSVALIDNELLGLTTLPFDPRHALAADTIIAVNACVGDINLDGIVSDADMQIVEGFLGTFSRSGVAWLEGDANLDGVVNNTDLALVSAHLGQQIPEPHLLSILAGMTLITRVAKRRTFVAKSRGA